MNLGFNLPVPALVLFPSNLFVFREGQHRFGEFELPFSNQHSFDEL